MKTAGLLTILISLAGFACAAVTAPEIDGNSLASGVVLVAGLLMIARARRR